jgi:hypothetical protein
LVPFTTRPPVTSRHGMMRLAITGANSVWPARRRKSSAEMHRGYRATNPLAMRAHRTETSPMVEVEVYAAGLRAPEKMMGLALELEAIPGLRYKVDTNHDIVYMEFTDKVLDAEALGSLFRRISLEAKFVGQLPPEVSEKKKTQRLDIGDAS